VHVVNITEKNDVALGEICLFWVLCPSCFQKCTNQSKATADQEHKHWRDV